ncbi:MAG: TetR family transcriptional regulator [Candidatus Paceibacterota bacterium]
MNETRSHNRKKTFNAIFQAIENLETNKQKISISAVAKTAGITPSLIHNTYPDVAEKIRALMGKTTRNQRDAKHEALVKAQMANRALRAELLDTRAFSAKLASNNQVLLNEIALLKGILSGKVISTDIDLHKENGTPQG